jgi:hypothetical protein
MSIRNAINRGEFPAVKLKKGVRVFEDNASHLRHNHPIACIDTKSGDRVCMTIVDENPGIVIP